jgi:hypothetical protein
MAVDKKVASHFYSMNAMLKCVRMYIDLFDHEQGVSHTAKHLNKRLDMAVAYYQNAFSKGLPDDVKKEWSEEWTKKDFESISNILDYWVEMNNRQRQELELICKELKDGSLKIVESLDDIPISKAVEASIIPAN